MIADGLPRRRKPTRNLMAALTAGRLADHSLPPLRRVAPGQPRHPGPFRVAVKTAGDLPEMCLLILKSAK
jgi:hypothetical protein